jgi:hypothetical protein
VSSLSGGGGGGDTATLSSFTTATDAADSGVGDHAGAGPSSAAQQQQQQHHYQQQQVQVPSGGRGGLGLVSLAGLHTALAGAGGDSGQGGGAAPPGLALPVFGSGAAGGADWTDLEY